MSGNELNAVVTQRIEVAPGLMVLRVVPTGWTLPAFEPGQYAVLGLPGSATRDPFSDSEAEPAKPDKLIKRAYSIASSSVAREYMEFFITMVRSGALTPRLFALKPGDRLFLGDKFKGVFTLAETPPDANIALIGTGTGLAPYMSMVRSQLQCDTQRRFAIIHGARHSWDLGYRSELITLARVCPNLSYVPVVSRPQEEPVAWSGAQGYVQDVWRSGALARAWGQTPTPANTHVFLCGNPAMVERMVEDLGSEGFVEHSRKQSGQIHVERYW